MEIKSRIYSGMQIRTTNTFWNFPYHGTILYELPNGVIAARITPQGYRECYSINLYPDEWELVEDTPDLHEDMYERGLFDAT